MNTIFELIDDGDADGICELLAADPAAGGLRDNIPAAAALLAAGADPNVLATASFARVSPLGTCAFAGANDVARELLEHGADPNLTLDPEATPLRVAESNGNDELRDLLLEHGAQ